MPSSPADPLWSSLSESVQGGENACIVGCPKCGDRLVQCLHCSYNFCPAKLASITKLGAKEMWYYNQKHYNKKHQTSSTAAGAADEDRPAAAAKRQRMAAGDEDDPEDYGYGGGDSYDYDDGQHMECDGSIDESCASIRDTEDSPLVGEEDAASADDQMYAEDDAFANQFNGQDLEPASFVVDVDQSLLPNPTSDETDEEKVYSFSDFDFLDTRTPDEKKARANSERVVISPTQLYFWQTYQRRREDPSDGTGGFAGITARTSRRFRGDPFRTAPRKEAYHMYLLLTLLLNLAGKLKGMLIDFQANAFQLFGAGSSLQDVQTRFPTNMTEARKTLLEGDNSLMKNFPSPKVYEIANHACVSLKEIILLAAGHGSEFNFAFDPSKPVEHQRNKEGLNGTEATSDLIEDVRRAMNDDSGLSAMQRMNTCIGWIYFWSDSFLRCFVRQRENSVWILTVTICPPESEKSNGKFTYVLAIGKSSEDHTPVIEHYVDQCMELMKGFECYFGATNEIRRMAVAMLTWSADRPERQAILNTLQEGTYGRVSGYATDVDEGKFPACLNCYQKLVKATIGQPEEEGNSGPCNQCFNWTLDPDNANQVTPAHENYPLQSACPGEAEPVGREAGKAFIRPLKLTAAYLIDALKKAYNARRRGFWTKPQLEQFFRACNVNAKRANIVNEMAEEDQKKNQASTPEKYLPKIWSLFDCFARYRLPDLPMHGLGHGIVPDVMDIVHKIFTNHRKLTHFIEFANGFLGDILSLRLDYCKVKPLPSSAWICENCMSFARLMPYLYGMYLLNNPLSANQNEDRVTVDNIKCMLNAFQAMMSLLMSKQRIAEDQDETKTTINNHMKLFMSTANHLHKTYGSLGKAAPAARGGATAANRAKVSSEDAVKNLGVLEAKTILERFGVTDPGGSDAQVRKLVRNIKEVELVAKLRDMGEDPTGDKPTLQQRLFGRITGRKLCKARTPSQEAEGMCWNKGNWLSFLVNIASQICYLGPLALIW